MNRIINEKELKTLILKMCRQEIEKQEIKKLWDWIYKLTDEVRMLKNKLEKS